MSAAQRLDAADGVIDGRFFGRPIVQAGAPQAFGAPVQSFGAQTFGAPVFQQAAYPTAYPTTVGGFGGVQTFAGAPFGFGAGSNAAALDAADGVIDGKFHGRPIVQAGAPVQTFGAFPQGFPQGFQQGFVGARTIGAPMQTFGAPVQTFGAFPQQGFQQGFVGASSTAAALDAADGVIDGQYFGRPIVQGNPTFVQNSPFIGGQTFGAPVQTFGAFPQGFPQQGFQQGFAAPAAFGGAGAAASLDAADGVIDGRFFGRPIVRA